MTQDIRSPKVGRWSSARAKLMQTQLSCVPYKCWLLHRATLALTTPALMITGVICVTTVTIFIIIAASINWLLQIVH